ncbi:MAG: hypothetical protein BHV81_06860 [Butyricimonas synergistica]|nr:MAG: hypothetical protein BHV81_06860 [Butyricimonas synergistica]
MKKDIDEILAAYLNKEPLTEEERQEFETWKNLSVHNEKVAKLVQKLEKQKNVLAKHQAQELAFTKAQQQVRQSRRKGQLIFWSSCAAGIILLIGFFFLLSPKNTHTKTQSINQTYISGLSLKRPTAELILPDGNKRLLSQEKGTIIVSDSNREMRTDKQTLIVESNTTKTREPEYYTISIPYGAEYNLILADGSKIYLNAGSTLRYPDQFVGDKREVFLTGEAYFEVKSDSLHPFVVHALDVTVRVLGTSFNVNAYAEGTWVKTTLVKGRVETHCGNKNIIMTPGTQVAYNKTTRESNYFPVNVQQFISWKDGYYDFEDMPLEELMQIFTRWYNLNIEFADPAIKKIKFSGRLKRYEDLRPLFEMLEYTRDVNFIITEDKIIIQQK